MSDISVSIRRCKRGNEKKLDLSNKGITYIPVDIYTLTDLEQLDLSNNRASELQERN